MNPLKLLKLLSKKVKQMSKKANAKMTAMISGVITVIFGIILIFRLVGGTAGDLTTAADNISGSGLPLASLFSATGIVMLIFMAGILLTVVSLAFGMAKGR